MAGVYPKTKGGGKANRTKPRLKSATPSSLGPRGRAAVKSRTSSYKRPTVRSGHPRSTAIVPGGSDSTKTKIGKGDVTQAEAKAAKARAKRMARAKAKAARPSGVTKVDKNIAHLKNAAKGASKGSLAAIALRIGQQYVDAEEKARKRNIKRAAGIKDA